LKIAFLIRLNSVIWKLSLYGKRGLVWILNFWQAITGKKSAQLLKQSIENEG
jgi:hypothetical protein